MVDVEFKDSFNFPSVGLKQIMLICSKCSTSTFQSIFRVALYFPLFPIGNFPHLDNAGKVVPPTRMLIKG